MKMKETSVQRVHFIVGPTAVGKTWLSRLIADQVKVEIISADSRQIYRYMDIGTAKPERAFLKRVKHHFIDICDPDAYYSAGMFAKSARETIDQIFLKGAQPLVVGGSGFYIKALVDGLFELDIKDDALRAQLEKRFEQEGLNVLYAELQKVDPAYAAKISPNDKQRILRALEVFLVSGKPFSSFHQQKTQAANFEPVFWGLHSERNLLYQRINQRVDEMLALGLIDEVRHLLDMGYDPKLNALNTVGYKEIIQYLQGMLTLPQAVELIKRNSRRYAKRQRTWFRADARIQWQTIVSKSDLERLALEIVHAMEAEKETMS